MSDARTGATFAALGGALVALAGALEMVTTSYLLGVGFPPDGALLVGTAGSALVLGTAGVVTGVGTVALAWVAARSPAPRPIGTAIVVMAVASLMVGLGGFLLGFLFGLAGGLLLRRAGRPSPAPTPPT
jgi:hypothetical protein